MSTLQAFASEDTYVDNFGAATNYGTNDPIYATDNAGDIARALLKFDLSSIPANATIVSATLTLYCPGGNASSAASMTVCACTSSWTEGAVTWNTQPTVGSSLGTFNYPTTVTTVTFSLTATVQSWVNGSLANNGIRVALTTEAPQGALQSFSSREHTGTTQDPVLDITYTTPGTHQMIV